MLSKTRKVKVRTSMNPHFPGEQLEVIISAKIPGSVKEADEFPYIGKTGLEIVQDYYATQQANAARQEVLAVSTNPTVEGCQAAADKVLTASKRGGKTVEASKDRLAELMAAGDVDALAAYLAAAGTKVS